MRIEETISDALDKCNNNRYKLAVLVGKRADELSKGQRPLIENLDLKNMKYVDIALAEVSRGLIYAKEKPTEI
jgi:DNA-directed RNA polymerase subunit omega